MKMDTAGTAGVIARGEAVLGIEFGSTRIKAELIGPDHAPIASGSHTWENRLENGVWTYALSDVWAGLQDAYRDLTADVRRRYGVSLERLGCIGFSAMMHGYLAFDAGGRLLTPFRTWRNTITGEAAAQLTQAFGFNIPQRWSSAHLYQAILNGESHVRDVAFLTTLAGYVHWQLSGRRVLGIGDASGMFPIDSEKKNFDGRMLDIFDELAAARGCPWKIRALLPQVLAAGEDAGTLTEAGALLLDPTGALQAGVPLCPPEGDAGTGMAATDSVAPRTGNVSAGTSIFAMVVLEKPLSRVYPEIDMVTTPDGAPVAMVHCNNCTTDLNAWVELFREVARLTGGSDDPGMLFTRLFEKSLEGAPDCGGLLPVNYYSGEGITHFDAGVPLLVHATESRFTLANLMRAHIYSTMATLKLGLDILGGEQVGLDRLMGHGGLFKTPGVAQCYLAAAAQAPVTVMATAGEGGAWGAALLAAYRKNRRPGQTLAQYLDGEVFAGMASTTLAPEAADAAGFAAFMQGYAQALRIERTAVEQQ